MKDLKDFKEDIHRCSKCGLCQAACPIYEATGNECTVSRGQFLMLGGVINNKLQMTKTINKYLDSCLKCSSCSKYCPSGIDVVEIIAAAKHEYFKKHPSEKIISFLQRHLIFGLLPNLANIFSPKLKSKLSNKKIIYFGGCGSKVTGNKAIIKILNNLDYEVITPNFNCCGIELFMRGDFATFNKYITEFINLIKKHNTTEIVTNCASCEKTIKSYSKWCNDENSKDFLSKLKIKNIYSYIHENNLKLSIKEKTKVTYHKPCNINNIDDVLWILNNTENLEYIEMKDFDKCCGLNGLKSIKNLKLTKNITQKKHKNITKTQAKYVLTSCLGCEIALKIRSKFKYKVYDLLNFIDCK